MILALHDPCGVELLCIEARRSRDLRAEALAFLRSLPASDLSALARGDHALALAVAARFVEALHPAPTPRA